MPLRGDHKRVYQRAYMRRYRRGRPAVGGGSKGEGGSNMASALLRDVRPVQANSDTNGSNMIHAGRSNDVPGGSGLGRTKDARWMRGYGSYLAARGLALSLQERGWEVVDLGTGEVGVYGTTGMQRERAGVEARLRALEMAYVQHQADHVLQEAQPYDSSVPLVYTQHPTEHTMREGS